MSDAPLHEQNSNHTIPQAGTGAARAPRRVQHWLTYTWLCVLSTLISLEQMTSAQFTRFAMSSLMGHAYLATIHGAQHLLTTVARPLLAHAMDRCGRKLSLAVMLVVYACGEAILAQATSIFPMYFAGFLIYSAGQTGVHLALQVWIADISTLTERALLTTVPVLPTLATIWIAPVMAQAFAPDQGGWRLGYRAWSFIIAACALPVLFLASSSRGRMTAGVLVLLSITYVAALMFPFATLIWIVVAAIGGGGGALVFSVLYLPRESLRRLQTNLALPCIGIMSMFTSFYLCESYYASYCQIVRRDSVMATGFVINSIMLSSVVSALGSGLVLKRGGRVLRLLRAAAFLSCVAPLLMVAVVRTYHADVTAWQSDLLAVLPLLAFGVSSGTFNVCSQLVVQATGSPKSVSLRTGVYLSCASLGGALGSSVTGGMWKAVVLEKLTAVLGREESVRVVSDIAVAASYTGDARVAIDGAFSAAQSRVALAALFPAAVALLACVCMESIDLEACSQHHSDLCDEYTSLITE